MREALSWFDRWMLRRIARRAVRQGDHEARIVGYLKPLVRAHRDEFTEDNDPTHRGFLGECLSRALAEERIGG